MGRAVPAAATLPRSLSQCMVEPEFKLRQAGPYVPVKSIRKAERDFPVV